MNSKLKCIVSQYGPGGRNCPCCGVAPRRRNKADRTAKRRLRRMLDAIDRAGEEE